MTAGAKALRALAAAPELLLSAPCAPSRQNEMEKGLCVVFVFNTRNCCHTECRRLLHILQCRHTMCKRVGCMDKRGWCACVRACDKWRTLLTRLLSLGALVSSLRRMCCTCWCVLYIFFSHEHGVTGRGLLYSGRDVCVCCVVALSGRLLHLTKRCKWLLPWIISHNRCRLRKERNA